MRDEDASSAARGRRAAARVVGDECVFGVRVDTETRCAHYDTDRDVIAIRFACCDAVFPCYRCHDAVADHDAEPWPRDAFGARAVLCGACESMLSIAAYLECDDACPECGHAFNPGCATHAHRYFVV